MSKNDEIRIYRFYLYSPFYIDMVRIFSIGQIEDGSDGERMVVASHLRRHVEIGR